MPAAIDGAGLRAGPLTSVANQALRTLGLEIGLTAPATTIEGAKGSSRAPVLTISYRDDRNALEQAASAFGQKLTTGPLQPSRGACSSSCRGRRRR